MTSHATAVAAHADLEQAVALHRAGRLADAVVLYRRALQSQRSSFDVLHRLGICLQQSGQTAEALKVLQQAVKRKPTAALAHLSLGEAYRGLRRDEEALVSYQRATLLAPRDPMVHLAKGVALEEMARYTEALAAYRAALHIDASQAAALAGVGNCLLMTGALNEALVEFDRALVLDPSHRLAAVNRAVTLTQLDRPAEALAACDSALAIHGEDAILLSNRGNALFALDRLEEALLCQERALALLPALQTAQLSRAVTLIYRNRLDDALSDLDRILIADPQHADAHRDRAMLLLKQGNFAAGWPEFEWRAAGRGVDPAAPALPRWRGDSSDAAALAGRTIVVYNEQGLGDTLHLARYVPLLAARGARVVLRVQPPLVSLLRRLSGAGHVIGSDVQLPPADCACPLMSLPLAFGTTLASIPAAVPYIDADPDRVAQWRARLGAPSVPRIGLAWSGSAANTNDGRRSVALHHWAGLIEAGNRAGYRFVALQPDLRDSDRTALDDLPVEYFGGQIADFDDSAALIANCERVICVDTAVAHLAGAMNKPVWILVPFAPDWRWMMERADSPWYPSARLFRQASPGDWDSVLADVRQALFDQAAALTPAVRHDSRAAA